MEALIHHFKIFTEGFKVPEGEAYVAIESPRGELGCYIVSDGSAKPYRMHIRGPSFVNLQTLPHMMRGGLIADAVAVISSRRSDHGRGRPLMARLDAPRTRSRAKEIIARYPRPKSALIPLLHLAQEQDGYVTDDAMAHIAELIDVTPGRGAGHLLVLRDVQARAGGRRTSSTSARTSRACSSAARSCSTTLEEPPRHQGRQHHADGTFTHRGRRVHRGVHRGAVPPGQLPLLLQGHPGRRRRARSTTSATVGAPTRSRSTASSPAPASSSRADRRGRQRRCPRPSAERAGRGCAAAEPPAAADADAGR